MIVENDHLQGKELRDQLGNLGFEVTRLCTSCPSAADMGQWRRPDVILMDIKALEQGGEEIQRIGSILDVPIVITTTTEDEHKLQRLQFGTPFGYLIKPANEWRLKTAVDMALRLAGSLSEPLQAGIDSRSEQDAFRLAAENALIRYQSLDEEGRFIEVNQAWLDLFGYSRGEVIGKSITEFLRPEFVDRFRRNFRRFKEVGEVLGAEFEMLKKDGDAVLVRLYGRIAWDEVGGFKQTHCVLQDISHQRIVEARLKESEQRYRQALETGRVGVWDLDPVTGAMFIHPYFKSLLGYEDHEIPNTLEAIEALIHPDDLDVIRKAREALVSGAPIRWRGEHRFIHKDGSARWFLVHAQVVSDRTGKLSRLVGASVDITERKRSEETLERFFNLSVDMLCVSDLEGNFKEINPAFEKTLGYSKEELLARPYIDFVHPNDKASTVAVTEMLKQGMPTIYFKNRYRTKAGEYRWLSWTSQPVPKLGVAYAVARDITDSTKAEEALKESRRSFKSLAENLPDVVTRFDRDLRYIYVNPGIEINTGMPPDQFIGKRIDEPDMPADLVAQWTASLKKVFALGKPETIEFEFLTPQGVGNFHSVLTPEFSEEGKIVSVLGVSRDITKRKLMEQALRESEEKFSILFFESPVWVAFSTFEDGRFLEANNAFFKVTGFSREEVIGKTSAQLDLWPNLGDRVDLVRHVRENGRLKDYPVTLRMKDGGLKDFLWTANVMDYKSEPCLLSVLVDVTEARKAERTLKTRERLLNTVLENTDNAIAMLSRKKNVIFYNPQFAELWKLEPEYLDTAPSLGDVIRRLPEKGVYASDGVDEFVAARMKQLDTLSGEVWTVMPRKDGVYVETRATRLPDGGFLLVYRDLTERKRIEAELQKTEKLEALGVLAGGIAHDFNNLLAGIIGNISLAKMDLQPGGPIYERMEAAENAGLRAKDLTYQLLTFAKGGAPVTKTSSIGDLIIESTSFILRGSNVKCVFELPADLWPVEIDESQINQVLNNLILNADQAMPAGGTILIRAENIPAGMSDLSLPLGHQEYVKISIRDDGIGIPKDFLSKIFDPFFTTKEKGNGLGLATSHSIVRHHKGYITVDSEVGKGTTFHVYLPASQKQEPKPSVSRERLVQGQGRILLIDDDPFVRDVASKMLERIGFEVEACEDGQKGVELYANALNRGDRFKAVIMDLTIPGGMGGEETIKLLREMDPHVKALVSSGYSNDPIMSNPRRYGFRGVVTKPYKLQDLNMALRTMLESED